MMCLTFKLVPLFLIEHSSITLTPNSPKGNATEEVPNLKFFGKFLRNPFPREGLFSIEAITITGPNPT